MKSIHSIRSVGIVALVGLAVWSLFIAWASVVRFGGDPRGLICLGANTRVPPEMATTPRSSAMGYDGQFYAALATDPLLLKKDTPLCLDNPSYRAERVGLPLIAWLLALTNGRAAVIVYLVVNWLLGVGIVVIAADSIRRSGHSPLWALPLLLTAGLVVSMIRCTPDAAATFFLLGALVLQYSGRLSSSVAAHSIAVLTRETSLLATASSAFTLIREKNWKRAALVVAIPSSLFALLIIRLHLLLPNGSSNLSGKFSLPFSGAFAKLNSLGNISAAISQADFWGLVGFDLAVLAALAFLVNWRKLDVFRASFCLFVALGAIANQSVWTESYAFARALLPLPFLATVIAAQDGRTWRRTLLAASVAASVISGGILAKDLAMGMSHYRPLQLLGIPGAGPINTIQIGLPSQDQASLDQARYLFPVACSRGRAGSEWRSDLDLANNTGKAAAITLELLAPHEGLAAVRRIEMKLSPWEKQTLANVVAGVFATTGLGALRVIAPSEEVEAHVRTYNTAVAGERPNTPSRMATDAVRSGMMAAFTGLLFDPLGGKEQRTNLGLLNPGALPIDIEIKLFDELGRNVGNLGAHLPPASFLQLNDIFSKAQAKPTRNGSARVTTQTPGGAFLAYASVVAGPGAPARTLDPTVLPQ